LREFAVDKGLREPGASHDDGFDFFLLRICGRQSSGRKSRFQWPYSNF
jgi:hypothetical protein